MTRSDIEFHLCLELLEDLEESAVDYGADESDEGALHRMGHARTKLENVLRTLIGEEEE